MAGTFVPFFEKSADDALPEYQFTQYRPGRVELRPPPTLKAPSIEVEHEEHRPSPQNVQRIDRNELKKKLQSDLRNAIALALPQETIQRIMSELAKLRPPSIASHDNPTESNGVGLDDPNLAGEASNITLEKDGDKVTNIIVKCDCGKVIELDCVY